MKTYILLLAIFAINLFGFEKAWELPVSGSVENLRFTKEDREFTFNIANTIYRVDAETGKILDSVVVNMDTLKKYGVEDMRGVTEDLENLYFYKIKVTNLTLYKMNLKNSNVKVLITENSMFGYDLVYLMVFSKYIYFNASYDYGYEFSDGISGMNYIFRNDSITYNTTNYFHSFGLNTYNNFFVFALHNHRSKKNPGGTGWSTSQEFEELFYNNKITTKLYSDKSTYDNRRELASFYSFDKNDTNVTSIYCNKFIDDVTKKINYTPEYIELVKTDFSRSTLAEKINLFNLDTLINGFNTKSFIYVKEGNTYLYDIFTKNTIDSINNIKVKATNLRYNSVIGFKDKTIICYRNNKEINKLAILGIDDTTYFYNNNLTNYIVKTNIKYDSINVKGINSIIKSDTIQYFSTKTGTYIMEIELYLEDIKYSFRKLFISIEKPMSNILSSTNRKIIPNSTFDNIVTTISFTYLLSGDYTKYSLKVVDMLNKEVKLDYNTTNSIYSFEMNKLGFYYLKENIEDKVGTNEYINIFNNDSIIENTEYIKHYKGFNSSKIWNDSIYIADYLVTSKYHSTEFVNKDVWYFLYESIGDFSVYNENSSKLTAIYSKKSGPVIQTQKNRYYLPTLAGEEQLVYNYLSENLSFTPPVLGSKDMHYHNGSYFPYYSISIERKNTFYHSDCKIGDSKYLIYKDFGFSFTKDNHPCYMININSKDTIINLNTNKNMKLKENNNGELISTIFDNKSVTINNCKLALNKLITNEKLYENNSLILDVMTTKNSSYILYQDSFGIKVDVYKSSNKSLQTIIIMQDFNDTIMNIYTNDDRFFSLVIKDNKGLQVRNYRIDDKSSNSYKIPMNMKFIINSISKNGELYLTTNNEANYYAMENTNQYLIKTKGNGDSINALLKEKIFSSIENADGQSGFINSYLISQSSDFSEASINFTDLKESADIVIYNVTGTIVNELKIQPNQKALQLNLSEYPIGYYFVRLRTLMSEENVGRFIVVR